MFVSLTLAGSWKQSQFNWLYFLRITFTLKIHFKAGRYISWVSFSFTWLIYYDGKSSLTFFPYSNKLRHIKCPECTSSEIISCYRREGTMVLLWEKHKHCVVTAFLWKYDHYTLCKSVNHPVITFCMPSSYFIMPLQVE